MGVVVLTCLVALTLVSPGKKSIDASWDQLAGFYKYSAPPLFKVLEEVDQTPTTTRTQLVFPGFAGQYARGTLVVPRSAGKHPLVVLLHGLGGNKEHALRMYGDALLASNCAVLALDAPNHGQSQGLAARTIMEKLNLQLERLSVRRDLVAEAYQLDSDSFETFFTGVIHDGVLNCRLALDHVLRRTDIDATRVQAIGNSMGAMMGVILASVDPRIKSVCLISGGDPIYDRIESSQHAKKELNLRAAPSLYAPKLAGRPVVMFNGLSDQTIPPQSAERLFAAAQDPKQIRWYASGHALPKFAISEAIAWVRDQAKPAPKSVEIALMHRWTIP